MTTDIFRISAILGLAAAVSCGGSSNNSGGGVGGSFVTGGQGGTPGLDGGSTGPAVWPGQGVDGGPWVPSQTCWDRAVAMVELMTPAQCYGQMTTVDSNGLTVNEATSAALGAVFSGGGSDPTSATTGQISNLIPDWLTMISAYLNVAKGYSPHAGMLYGLDSVHGNNNVQDAVLFPHAIGIGATRNAAVAEQVGRITAIEMLGVGANWAFTPTVAAAQDERWGRTYETFGEKNELTTQMSVAMIKGLQGAKLGAQSVLACAKHYAGDGNTDGGKNAGNVTTLDEAAFRRLAIEPYRPAIEAGVGSIMPSYSSFQGVKMTASKYWLTDVLKGELGFQGFLVSDWDAVAQLPGNWTEQVKTAFNAGLDMAMLSHGSGSKTAASLASTLSALVTSGDIPIARIKDAVRRILTVKCEMGLLDADATIDPAVTASIGSAEHRAAARSAVRQSMVLLKNDGTLPLAKTLSRIHVTGPAANSLSRQCGGWSLGWQGLGAGTGTANTTGTTVQAAIISMFAGTGTTVTTSTDGTGAAGADYAIVVVGEMPYAEGQGDKANPTLLAADFQAIAKVKGSGVPFAVVLFSGRPLVLTDSSGASAVDQANAFIAAWLPGTEGTGITDVLFGDYKPTGKLGFTWPATLAQIPIHDGDGQTPLFPYGFGLTYP